MDANPSNFSMSKPLICYFCVTTQGASVFALVTHFNGLSTLSKLVFIAVLVFCPLVIEQNIGPVNSKTNESVINNGHGQGGPTLLTSSGDLYQSEVEIAL